MFVSAGAPWASPSVSLEKRSKETAAHGVTWPPRMVSFSALSCVVTQFQCYFPRRLRGKEA